jgi:hypothetical protein
VIEGRKEDLLRKLQDARGWYSNENIHITTARTSLKSRSSPVEIQEPRRQEQNGQIASNKRSKDAQIPPPILELIPERLIKLVANFVRAVLACTRRVVKKITRRATAEEIGHVLSAVLALGCAELVEFAGLADDGQVVQLGDDHAADQASEGVQLVKPDAPELGDQGLGNGDTAEERKDDDDL